MKVKLSILLIATLVCLASALGKNTTETVKVANQTEEQLRNVRSAESASVSVESVEDDSAEKRLLKPVLNRRKRSAESDSDSQGSDEQ